MTNFLIEGVIIYIYYNYIILNMVVKLTPLQIYSSLIYTTPAILTFT